MEDEVRCPKSGYSIDMIVHDSGRGMGGERRSSAVMWAVEFDGPSHFLRSRAPTGATLLKRQMPNAGMNNFELARSEGPSGLPSSDQMIMQQWQAQLLMHMLQQMMHMHSMIEMLREQNRTLKMAHPNMDMRELEQKKEMLEKDVLELLQ